MSYEDRYDAKCDYDSERRSGGHDEGFAEGFARAKELIRGFIIGHQGIKKGNAHLFIDFIDELEEE